MQEQGGSTSCRSARRSRHGRAVAAPGLVLGLALGLTACGTAGTGAGKGVAATPPSGTGTRASPAVTTTGPARPTTTSRPSPHVGQAATDGVLTFTVTIVQCNVSHVGRGEHGLNAPPGRQWCLVSLAVANRGMSAQRFSAFDQYGVDASGRRLPADVAAIDQLPGDTRAVTTTIEPGARVTVVLPFQLGASDSIAKFVLHRSASSKGVTVLNMG